MENTTPNPTMQPPVETTPVQPPAPHKHGGTGAFIGSLIIILVILLGGVYMWNKVLEKSNPGATVTPEAMMADTGTDLKESNDTASIEADLNGSNFDDLDKEMNDIDAEFEAN